MPRPVFDSVWKRINRATASMATRYNVLTVCETYCPKGLGKTTQGEPVPAGLFRLVKLLVGSSHHF